MRYFLAAMVGLAFAVMAFGLVAIVTCYFVVPALLRLSRYSDPTVIIIVIVGGGVMGLAAAIVAGYLGAKLVLGSRD